MNIRIQELLSQKDDRWRFPGTVYDTFSKLYSIALYDRKLLHGEPLGKIAALLVSVESRPGGPYFSEFPDRTERGKEHACDRKTNEMIRRFLSIYDVRLSNLEDFLHGKKRKRKTKGKKSQQANMQLTSSEAAMLEKIRGLLRSRLAPFHRDFKKLARDVVERTIRGNPDKQMSLMTHYMKIAMGHKAEKISEEIVVACGLANVFFWTAFIIYDDFWDEDESADPKLLPVANFFARSYIDFFSSVLSPETGFKKFFHDLMDELDGANVWETTRCRANVAGDTFEVPTPLPRYGDYRKKYLPASGHILGPLAILMLTGYGIDSREAQHLREYFTPYLIAMQMNDDMHDWEEDLRRGHISTALPTLLRDFGTGRKIIDLEKDMPELRRTFWFITLPKLARNALRHTEKSRAALKAIKSIENPAPLLYFIDLNRDIALRALREKEQSVSFLKAYIKSNII